MRGRLRDEPRQAVVGKVQARLGPGFPAEHVDAPFRDDLEDRIWWSGWSVVYDRVRDRNKKEGGHEVPD